MPRALELSLACGTYDVNQALIDGRIVPQGTDLTVMTYPSPERHWRMSRHLEFDICEFSMATYIVLHDRGTFPVTAVPAFPHRRFRHGYVFVNADAGIRSPRDLEGRRIGVRTWETTAGLWARGILQDEYGVDLTSIDWVAQDPEDVPLVHAERFRIRPVADGDTVTAMLERGDLDGLIYPELPGAIRRGDPRVKPLFPDARQAEMDYVSRTGFFPIMHTVLIRRSLADEHPWLPLNVLEAFRQSKDLAFQLMADPRRVSLAWLREAMAEQEQWLGPDPWAYDFERNREQIQTMIRWSREQGLIESEYPAADLFAASTVADVPAYV
jgi:4,5-dihydroxyphthalate decarboxylase